MRSRSLAGGNLIAVKRTDAITATVCGLLCLIGSLFATGAQADDPFDQDAACQGYANRYAEITAELDRRWQDARGLPDIEYIGFHIQTLTHFAQELRALSVELGCDPASFVRVYTDD